MTSESQIKHHPDDWSFTSDHHHHVERTVHPVIVELIKWARTSQSPTASYAQEASREESFTHILSHSSNVIACSVSTGIGC